MSQPEIEPPDSESIIHIDDEERSESTSRSTELPSLEPPTTLEHTTTESFFKDESIMKEIREISTSSFASFGDPKAPYQKIINILAVSRSMRMSDKQFGAEFCPITIAYRQLRRDKFPVSQIHLELKKALENFRNSTQFADSKCKRARRQSSVTEFFKKVNIDGGSMNDASASNCSSLSSPSSSSAVQLQSGPDDGENNSKAAQASHSLAGLLNVLDLHDVDGSMIENTLKMDANMLQSKDTVGLIKKFTTLRRDFLVKQHHQHPNSSFSTDLRQVEGDLTVLKEDIRKLSELCNKDKNWQTAQSLPMSEMGKFMSMKFDEATSMSKQIFLKLNSMPLKAILRKVVHAFQKRLSYYKAIESPEDDTLNFVCSNPSQSWDDCLQKILDNGWTPSSQNGNLEYSHFEKCKDLFVSMRRRGDHFVSDNEMLGWLGLTGGSKAAILSSLTQNLPILQIKKSGAAILINVISFLNDPDMLTEFMEVFNNDDQVPSSSEDAEIELRRGTPHEDPRKPGSGRPRIIGQNPEILEVVTDFAESAGHGMAAHGRRRDEVGLFGFSMPDLRRHVQEKLFKDNPDKAPSEKTLRRLFEAPSQVANAKSRYRAEIRARPGTHQNDAAAGGDRHPHQHQCFTIFKLIR